MKIQQGKSVYKGIAIGKISIYQNGQQVVKRRHVDDVEAEIKRFEDARDLAVEQLGNLYEKALTEVGEANAAIFEVHQMMLEDLDYEESIINIIRNQELNAEYAVASTGENFSEMFASMDDDYMKGRAADVKDVSERLVRVLSGVGEERLGTDEPVIIVADDLAPSETIQLDKSKVNRIGMERWQSWMDSRVRFMWSRPKKFWKKRDGSRKRKRKRNAFSKI